SFHVAAHYGVRLAARNCRHGGGTLSPGRVQEEFFAGRGFWRRRPGTCRALQKGEAFSACEHRKVGNLRRTNSEVRATRPGRNWGNHKVPEAQDTKNRRLER